MRLYLVSYFIFCFVNFKPVLSSVGWWLGVVAVTCFIRSTKLLCAGPG